MANDRFRKMTDDELRETAREAQEVADWLQSLMDEMRRTAARARKEIKRRGREDHR